MMLPVDPAKYYAFLVAMFFMAISPGPAVMFFVRTGLAGRKTNVFTGAIGVNAATLSWFIGSAIGLQVLMAAFPLAFRVLALFGGLYLGWLGFKTFRHALNLKDEVLDPRFSVPSERKSPLQTLREGFMVQILNPKILLFFSAVLPPFVDMHRPMPAQMGVLAATALGMDSVAFLTYGLAAVTLSHALGEPRNKQKFDLGAGVILMLIAALILWHAAGDFIKA